MFEFICGIIFGVFTVAIAYVVWYVITKDKEQDDVS